MSRRPWWSGTDKALVGGIRARRLLDPVAQEFWDRLFSYVAVWTQTPEQSDAGFTEGSVGIRQGDGDRDVADDEKTYNRVQVQWMANHGDGAELDKPLHPGWLCPTNNNNKKEKKRKKKMGRRTIYAKKQPQGKAVTAFIAYE
jgi:hypothetical protein